MPQHICRLETLEFIKYTHDKNDNLDGQANGSRNNDFYDQSAAIFCDVNYDSNKQWTVYKQPYTKSGPFKNISNFNKSPFNAGTANHSTRIKFVHTGDRNNYSTHFNC